MPIIKISDLKSFSGGFTFSQKRNFSTRKDKLYEARNAAAVTVFLSHSHTDKDAVEDAIALLSGMGVEVYVDWQDEEMPAVTNAETANKIKVKIRENKKFVLLASPKAIISNWVNWELGVGDTHKYIDHIALLPFVRGNNSWKDAEYLRIYPSIQKDYSFSGGNLKSDYRVIYPDGNYKSLEQWLKA